MIEIIEAERDYLPWERARGESERAYNYFVKYRDQGSKRSLRSLAQQEGLSFRQLGKHSSKWRWKERVAAWQDELDRIRREATIKEVQEMTKRHSQQSMMFQRVLIMPAEAALKKLKSNHSEIADFENLPLKTLFDLTIDASRMFAQIVDTERKSRGEPNEILKQDLSSQGKQLQIILPPGINTAEEVDLIDDDGDDFGDVE